MEACGIGGIIESHFIGLGKSALNKSEKYALTSECLFTIIQI